MMDSLRLAARRAWYVECTYGQVGRVAGLSGTQKS